GWPWRWRLSRPVPSPMASGWSNWPDPAWPGPARPRTRSWLHGHDQRTRAKLAIVRGDPAAARADARQSLAIFRERGDRRGQLQAIEWLGAAEAATGDHGQAARLHRDGLAWPKNSACGHKRQTLLRQVAQRRRP